MVDTTQTAVELDVVIEPDDNVSELLAGMVGGRDIEVEVVEQYGPTGWPLVRFAGPADQLQSMLAEAGYDDPLDVYAVAR